MGDFEKVVTAAMWRIFWWLRCSVWPPHPAGDLVVLVLDGMPDSDLRDLEAAVWRGAACAVSHEARWLLVGVAAGLHRVLTAREDQAVAQLRAELDRVAAEDWR